MIDILWNYILNIFFYLTVFLFIKVLINFVYDILPFILNKNSKYKFIEKYGKNLYVLITGSSEGIGLSFGLHFAKLGFNIILTGRNLKKLENSKNNILDKLKKKVNIICFEIDFLDFHYLKKFNEFMKKIDNYDISVLINNWGNSNNGPYDSIKYKDLIDEVELNCLPMIFLTKKFVPIFQKRFKKCAIINISSLAAYELCTHHFNYNASKRLVYYISNSLKNLKRDNIDILTVTPGIVKTKLYLSKVGFNSKFNIFMCYTNDTINGCFKNLGYNYLCDGSLFHLIIHNIMNFFNSYLKIFNLYKKNLKQISNALREEELKHLKNN